MGGAVRELLKRCPEFQDIVSLDALRVLYAPSRSTAFASKSILATVETPENYETANAMIHT